VAPAGIEYYLPLFFDARDLHRTLFDYLPVSALPVLADGAAKPPKRSGSRPAKRYEQRRHDIERPVLPPDELYLSPDALRERLNQRHPHRGLRPRHPRRAEAQPLGDQPRPRCRWPRSDACRRRRRCARSSAAIPAAC
jgi:transcription-repair coupling factor (superfamily II helicase)